MQEQSRDWLGASLHVTLCVLSKRQKREKKSKKWIIWRISDGGAGIHYRSTGSDSRPILCFKYIFFLFLKNIFTNCNLSSGETFFFAFVCFCLSFHRQSTSWPRINTVGPERRWRSKWLGLLRLHNRARLCAAGDLKATQGRADL